MQPDDDRVLAAISDLEIDARGAATVKRRTNSDASANAIARCCCACVTALHEAIRGGYLPIVERLLAAGADPRIPCEETPTLELARKQENPEIVRRVQDALARRALPAK
jgi:hypothetical protein